jgi:hypothetical protein
MIHWNAGRLHDEDSGCLSERRRHAAYGVSRACMRRRVARRA